MTKLTQDRWLSGKLASREHPQKLHVGFNVKSGNILVPMKSHHYVPTEI